MSAAFVCRCAAMMAAAWPLLSSALPAVDAASVVATSGHRHRRQLQNSYLGLGSGVEILPVGDTSGVSSSYSVVETSKLPQRREFSAHRAAGVRNSRRRDDDEERQQSAGSGRVRFPDEGRRKGQKSGSDDEDLDLDQRRPGNRRAGKGKPKKPQDDFGDSEEDDFGESKSSTAGKASAKVAPPRNIKDIVEERPAESKISGDLNEPAGSGFIGGGAYGGGAEYDKQKHFEKQQKEKFMEGHKSEEGEKAEKAFKKEEAFDKGEKEDYGADQKKSQVEEKAGEKKGHVDQSQHTGEAFQSNHGEKGISVVKKGGSKKGKKTSGFHKVHHKDEYKKDEVFYDESHDGNEHEEHQNEQEKHAKEKGASEKQGHTDTSYHESHGSKKGESDHGKKYQQHKGHNKEAGEQAHSGEQSQFSKKGGQKEGEKYGHSEGAGGGYFEKGGYF